MVITGRTSTQRDQASAALDRLQEAWERSDAIFDMILPGSLLERPIGQRHPILFYVGHLPAFTRNMLVTDVLKRPAFNERFDGFFDFGIDPEEGEEETRAAWPDLREVLAYRDRVRGEVLGCAAELAERAAEHPLADGARILHLVREHEEMHHETLLYMLQELGTEHMRKPAWWGDPVTGDPCAANESVLVPAGPVELGVEQDDVDFGWDNEFPARTTRVDAFSLDRLPVTIGEFLEFVEAGGYSARDVWSEEGWAWIQKHGVRHPKDWVERGGRWFVRAMFEHLPLDEVRGWPVCVTLTEARAFAKWRGGRLPLEKELVRAAYRDPETPYPWGTAEPAERHGNFAFRAHGPTPVGSYPDGASPMGIEELIGNGWEWTDTPFQAHEGFENYLEGYPGYSKDFFDGSHFVLFGGSWATADGLVRRSFRNWFRYNYPYPFTKFRVARDA